MVPGIGVSVVVQIRLRHLGERLHSRADMDVPRHNGILFGWIASERGGRARGLLPMAHHRNLPGPDDIPIRAQRQDLHAVPLLGFFQVLASRGRCEGGASSNDGRGRGRQSLQRVAQPAVSAREDLRSDKHPAGAGRHLDGPVRSRHHEPRALRGDSVCFRKRHHANVGGFQRAALEPSSDGRYPPLPPRGIRCEQRYVQVDLSVERSQADPDVCRRAAGPGGQIHLLHDLLRHRLHLLRTANQSDP
mmetsp:Transcript_18949/g.43971  ORF Transcript_18949/g.43971 Transcript_18949/m.43971 type:complete len:247 (-) Transcript_18949:986-1726(-)